MSLTLRVLAPADGSSSATYTNTGCVSPAPDDTTPVVRPDDDCDTVKVPVTSKPTTSGLGIVKANEPTGVVTFGSTITYTLTASVPEGSIPQTEVVVTDTLPGLRRRPSRTPARPPMSPTRRPAWEHRLLPGPVT